MIRTAIVAAMHDELASAVARMAGEREFTVGGRRFWSGRMHGQEVVLTVSGIGKVAAATTATVLIQHFGAQRIVFTGVAGGLGPGVKVGDVVVATHTLQHDLDVSPIFPRHEVPGYGTSRFATDVALCEQLSQAAHQVLRELPSHLDAHAIERFGLHSARCHQGLLVSGDRFVSTAAESRALQAELPDALAVEMEGAAFAQVCCDFGVPLAVVRTISDRADDNAHADFNAFLHQVASRYSSGFVDAWLSCCAAT